MTLQSCGSLIPYAENKGFPAEFDMQSTFPKPSSYSLSLPCSASYHNYTQIPIIQGDASLHFPSTTICFSSLRISSMNHKQTLNLDAEIRKSCQMGNLKKAMELLGDSENFDLESTTYCSILQLCAETKSLREGEKVRSVIDLMGVEIDSSLGSKLVFMYVKCGDLGEGRRIFDRIGNEKVFLWNLLINEYAKIGNFAESVCLYKRMLVLGVEPNSYTFSGILKCFAVQGKVIDGEKVHGFLLRLGFGSYNTVVNSLIAFYFKCKRTSSARKLFDELSDRDVISWNSMISGYVANNLAKNGVEIFLEMLSSGISVDLATLLSVLAACANIGCILLLKSVHVYAIKAGFNHKINFSNTLLDAYSKCGDMDSSVHVFENMVERNVVTWTSMIAGYARKGFSTKAIDSFYEMKKEGIKPDIFTITTILHACACDCSLENGKEVHTYISENNMQSNLFVSNALIDMYAKCGSMNDAYSVFSSMTNKDIVSWNTMIGGYSKNSLPNEALNLVSEMQRYFKPDNVTVTCVVPALASLAALDRGQEIHCHILRNGLSLDRYILNALIDMYVKCGAVVLARRIFDTIPNKDLVTWTIMIAGYGMHGFGREAISTFNEMRRTGIDPDEISFVSILYACSHSGLVDEGWRFYNLMIHEFKIEPKLEHYACIVDLLARAGELVKAHDFITKMPLEADATIWGSLLCGCRIHRDVKLAEKVSEKVFELEPDNTGYYVLLANIYAESEKWEEVKKIRDRIGRGRLKKDPGCSWIEINGNVQVFVAGRSGYIQERQIVAFLRRLRKRMKQEGYYPKLDLSLRDGDEMEKEMALCGHSEKLAMAFGILNLPPGKMVRVTKNLRVCGDCHEMAKYMSKIIAREIVLRDSNRFHHFNDGVCSCRGYW